MLDLQESLHRMVKAQYAVVWPCFEGTSYLRLYNLNCLVAAEGARLKKTRKKQVEKWIGKRCIT